MRKWKSDRILAVVVHRLPKELAPLVEAAPRIGLKHPELIGARKDAPALARIAGRHDLNDVPLEPAQRAGSHEVHKTGRVCERIDGTAEENKGAGREVAIFGRQQSDSCKGRHGALRDRDHVQIWSQCPDHAYDVADAVTDAEP